MPQTQTQYDPLQRFNEYVQAVQDGTRVVGELERLAVERHVRDLAEAWDERGLWFDTGAASAAILFIEAFLTLSCAGHPKFRLEGWQAFIVGSLFGWKREDGRRRFRFGWLEVARKNGKSTLAAAIGVYLLLADGEMYAEVYSAATKKKQARIVHTEGVRMIQRSTALLRHCRIFKDNISVDATGSKWELLEWSPDTQDGLNVHGALIDEVHKHPKRDLIDVLKTATGSRPQSLLFFTTTAGHDRKSVCYEWSNRCEQVLRGLLDDDRLFAFIARPDEDDDPWDEATWCKANPNLGITLDVDDLQAEAREAQEQPAFTNTFLRLRLNIWTESATRAISMVLWNENRGPREYGKLREGTRGRECIAGLDLSSTGDLTTLVRLFPQYVHGVEDDDDVDPDSLEPGYEVVVDTWLPEDDLHDRVRMDGVRYDVWLRQGLLRVTPGNTIDYDALRRDITGPGGIASQCNIKQLAVDYLFQGAQLAGQLAQDGLKVVPIRMGFLTLGPATGELLRQLKRRRLWHGDHPILRWQADNLVTVQDAAGNLKPSKEKSTERIDAMVGAIMAMARAMLRGKRRSVYDRRGVVTLWSDRQRE